MRNEGGVLVKATNGAPFEFPIETWTDEHPARMVIKERKDGYLELYYAGTILATKRPFIYPLIENAMYDIDKVKFTELSDHRIKIVLPGYTSVLTGANDFWKFYQEVEALPNECGSRILVFPSDDLLVQLSKTPNNEHVGILGDSDFRYFMTAKALAFELYASMFYRQYKTMIHALRKSKDNAFSVAFGTSGGYTVNIEGYLMGKSVLKITNCEIY